MSVNADVYTPEDPEYHDTSCVGDKNMYFFPSDTFSFDPIFLYRGKVLIPAVR